MARFGGMTALRAALGAVSGITEGLEQREVLAREKERQDAIMKRQAELDAAAMRNEQREAIDMGMVAADQYNPRGIAGGMDMPGATPRQPIFRQKIGGTEFVLPESKRYTQHREGLEKIRAERAGDLRDRKEMEDLTIAAQKGGRGSPAFAKLIARNSAMANALERQPYSGPGFASLDFRRELEDQKRDQKLDAAEAWFNTLLGTKQPEAYAVMDLYKKIRAANPSADPRELMLSARDAYDAGLKSENIQARTDLTNKRTQTMRQPRSGALPPGVRAPASAAKPDSSAGKPDELDAAFDRYTTKKR